MSEMEGFSLIDISMRQWEKELALKKDALQTLQDYEAEYRQTTTTLKSLADDTMQVWEAAYNELKQQTAEGFPIDSLERLDDFVLRTRAALTEYRRAKAGAEDRFRKAPIDLSQWSRQGSVRDDVVREVKRVETLVVELVKDSKERAASVLQYLRDIHEDAQAMYKALRAKVDRIAVPLPPGESTDLLQAVHARLAQTGKVNLSYQDFASLLREGRGSFHFAGRQNDLAYLLLFLKRNGFAENWKGLNLSYVKNGVAAKTSAQSIKEAHKKFSTRNEPEIKPLLAGLRDSFPELTLP